jgi:hypothetical protein
LGGCPGGQVSGWEGIIGVRMPRPPQHWSRAELEKDAATARKLFVKERRQALSAERALYLGALAEYSDDVVALLGASGDLLNPKPDVLRQRRLLDIARYTLPPPISLDDLDTLTDSSFGAWVKQTTDRGQKPTSKAFRDAAKIIGERIDGQRAPWIAAKRVPTKQEREIFVKATASVRAMRKVETERRMERSKLQEERARAAIQKAKYEGVETPGTLRDPIYQMPSASYALKSRRLNATNMDIPVRLKANHGTGLLFLALEAKVSNSTINSRKRLVEVSRKRERWDSSGALYQFRTGAVLAGVYDVERLLEAQESGVLIFWEHRLKDLTDFLK